MRRLLIALAGYAFYRWWNSQPAPTERPVAQAKRTPPRAKPAARQKSA